MAVLNGSSKKAPLYVFTAFPGEGHMNPVLGVADSMVQRGHEAVFILPAAYKPKVDKIGAEFFESPEALTPDVWGKLAQSATMEPAEGRVFAIKAVFFASLPARTDRVAEVLEELRARDPERQIIFMEDIFNATLLPFRYGRPLPKGFDKFPTSIAIGCAAVLRDSIDVGPMVMGLLPDSSQSGKQRNSLLIKMAREGPLKTWLDGYRDAIQQAGGPEVASLEGLNLYNEAYDQYDAVFQMCSPSMDYPMSDLAGTVQFAGVLPRKPTESTEGLPEWWPELQGARAAGKEVVFVTQGTVQHNYNELIVPTLKTLADRPDTLVVAALGAPGAKLPEGFEAPANARVSDYIPYDAALEYADVFVCNGGYGAFTHTVRNGVPAVLAGQTEDKAEVALRAVYAGIAVNLQTQTPSVGKVRAGVEEVLAESKYKKRAVELMKENEKLDSLGMIERFLVSLAI